MSELLVNGKMPNIDDRVKAWGHFTFKESGDTICLHEMPEEPREAVIRTIVHQKMEGVAYDKDMVPLENFGGAMPETCANGVRFYNAEELENFGLKYLRTLCEGHKIDHNGLDGKKMALAILKAQGDAAQAAGSGDTGQNQ